MRDGTRSACVTRRRCRAWSAPCGGDLDDLLGEGEVEPGVEVGLRLGGVGALAEGPGGAGEGDGVEAGEGAAPGGEGRGGSGWGSGGGGCRVGRVVVSMMGMSSSASQQSTTWARMRCSRRW